MNFFLVSAEFLLISMYDNIVKTNSDSTNFRLLRTRTSPHIKDNAGYIEIKTTAGDGCLANRTAVVTV